MKPRKPLPRSTKPLKRMPIKRTTPKRKPEPGGRNLKQKAAADFARYEIPKKRKGPPRRVSVVRDPGYMKWLHTQLCVVCKYRYPGSDVDLTLQMTESEPAHTKNNGRSSKGPDDSCIPLCHRCHAEMDGRLSTKITTKAAFAEKYDLDLAAIASWYYARYTTETGSE